MVSLHAADVAVHSFDVSGPGFALTLPSRSVRSALRTLEYALLVLTRIQRDPPTAFHEALHTSLLPAARIGGFFMSQPLGSSPDYALLDKSGFRLRHFISLHQPLAPRKDNLTLVVRHSG